MSKDYPKLQCPEMHTESIFLDLSMPSMKDGPCLKQIVLKMGHYTHCRVWFCDFYVLKRQIHVLRISGILFINMSLDLYLANVLNNRTTCSNIVSGIHFFRLSPDEVSFYSLKSFSRHHHTKVPLSMMLVSIDIFSS